MDVLSNFGSACKHSLTPQYRRADLLNGWQQQEWPCRCRWSYFSIKVNGDFEVSDIFEVNGVQSARFLEAPWGPAAVMSMTWREIFACF